MKQQNRHIVVLLDHKSALQFGAEAQFSNVKIVTLPPNTSMPQCANMITSLKKLFRKHQACSVTCGACCCVCIDLTAAGPFGYRTH